VSQIFGKIRYMSYNAYKAKFHIKAYIKKKFVKSGKSRSLYGFLADSENSVL